jgi:hypothetical protein
MHRQAAGWTGFRFPEREGDGTRGRCSASPRPRGHLDTPIPAPDRRAGRAEACQVSTTPATDGQSMSGEPHQAGPRHRHLPPCQDLPAMYR